MSGLDAVFDDADDFGERASERMVAVVSEVVPCEPRRARRLLHEAGISPRATVRSVGVRQRPVISRCVASAMARRDG